MQISTTNSRQDFRELRRELDDEAQSMHAAGLAQALDTHPVLQTAERIACYLPYDGEIGTKAIIEACWARGQQVFLPVLASRENSLSFAAYTPNTRLAPNRFGIDEPDCTALECLDAAQLDVIMLPMVAFDDDGNRMGMGGGFYDRSLAFLKHGTGHERPFLIGLAHEIQRAEGLESKSWDIPVGAIATETGVRIIR